MVRVSYIIFGLWASQLRNRELLEGQALEIVWTIFPAVILVGVAIPSLTLLYRLDSASEAALTLKVIGHQWY